MKFVSEKRDLLFSTVRIETLDSDGEAVGVGTSFVVSDPRSPPGHELFLVSNKHVIQSGWTSHIFFTRRKADGAPELGTPVILRVDGFEPQWQGHPDEDVDVAVMPLSWQLQLIAKDNTQLFIHPISLDDVATDEHVAGLSIASPVLFVGYPDGMFDEVHCTPVVRQGCVATPAELDFNGMPVFLIDASVFPGSSGSPVFAYERAWDGGLADIRLLGIISAVLTQRTDGEVEWAPAPTASLPIASFHQMIDLGLVFKARLIGEAIAEFWRKNPRP
jgi:hypothetical protein